MGRASRIKRERRETAEFTTSLTACEGSWIESPPTPSELSRISQARQALQQYRSLASELAADQEAANRFSLDVFRLDRFRPLYFEDWVIEQVIERYGEPPVVEDESDPAFSDYLRNAVLSIANSRVRRAMANQVTRFIPGLVEQGMVREALAVEYNIFMTVMSDAVTPLLAQTMVGGFARYYDAEDEGEPAEDGEVAQPAEEAAP